MSKTGQLSFQTNQLDLPKNDSVPYHDIVFWWGPANSSWRILLQPNNKRKVVSQNQSVFICIEPILNKSHLMTLCKLSRSRLECLFNFLYRALGDSGEKKKTKKNRHKSRSNVKNMGNITTRHTVLHHQWHILCPTDRRVCSIWNQVKVRSQFADTPVKKTSPTFKAGWLLLIWICLINTMVSIIL